ncbi:glycoside hydrolase family 3 protein [Laceyella putida]|uniref:beta-N-acetylhexosaminidase n=1 Tax=Laceyella putida TaxID=110101 RepID=A0ABW2RKB6_9BACL
MSRWVEERLQSLTLEQKIGQLLVGQAEGTEVSESFRRFIEKIPIAGYRINGPNIEHPGQVKSLTAEIQRIYARLGLDFPVIFACDQEGGVLSVFGDCVSEFPGNMALGAADSVALTERQGQLVGWELSEMGMNHLLAPVADLNLEKQNPVIGVRSFGDDPERVASHCIHFQRGANRGGVAVSAKHFPGHGNTATDTHLGLATNHTEKDVLRRTELVPFQKMVNAGVDSVMVTHVVFSEWGSMPASLSPTVISGLLRHEMGYDGLVITDDLAMGAVRNLVSAGESVLRFIQAGGDIAYMHDGRASIEEAYGRLLEAVRSGELTEERIHLSLRRILRFKQRIATYQHAREKLGTSGTDLARQVAEQSITLLRDPGRLLPVAPDKKLLVVLPQLCNLSEADTSDQQEMKLVTYLKQAYPQVSVVELSLDEAARDGLWQKANEADLILQGTINAYRFPGQIAVMKKLAEIRPLIAIMLRDPYDSELIPFDTTVLATYAVTEQQMATLVRQLQGALTFKGKVPVKLDDHVKRRKEEW